MGTAVESHAVVRAKQQPQQQQPEQRHQCRGGWDAEDAPRKLDLGGRHAAVGVNDEQDHVRAGDGRGSVRQHLCLHGRVAGGPDAPSLCVLEAARVHAGEAQAPDVRLGLLPVPRRTRRLVHNRQAPPVQLVEEARLAHVGATHQGNCQLLGERSCVGSRGIGTLRCASRLFLG